MNDLRIRDIIDLVVAKVDDPTRTVKETYDWMYARYSMVTKGIFALTAFLFVALFGLFYQPDSSDPENETDAIQKFGFSQPESWKTGTVVGGLVAAAATLFYRINNLRGMAGQYISALRLLRQIADAQSFFSLYRRRWDR